MNCKVFLEISCLITLGLGFFFPLLVFLLVYIFDFLFPWVVCVCVCVCALMLACVLACAHRYACHVLLGFFAFFFIFLLRDGKKAWRWMGGEDLGDEGEDGGYCNQNILHENYTPKIINHIQDFF